MGYSERLKQAEMILDEATDHLIDMAKLLVERQEIEINELRDENEQLKDEMARLKEAL